MHHDESSMAKVKSEPGEDRPTADNRPGPLLKHRKPSGRPCRASVNSGYLHQKIAAAEASVKDLAEEVAALEVDNARKTAVLDCCASGLEAADVHLSFLLISRCAFSRKTRAVLALEDANQVRDILIFSTGSRDLVKQILVQW